ncbi:TetR/AcrR family transcriptional regulator [Streptomyces sp. G2]|uniref:TetR family transcriptional regulator n=1 Tax=Streptomyces hydrogenans TaxID=1873719 RepID=A0ABQ3PR50_9ACTN|nr:MULTISPECIES: TetR/AcrR family transcriptional regulator [Streptomyces]MCM1950309.1 TetR/AcrR family transcriptional regulator [Streptomyces sp. G2]GHG22748.1 TetR family transcriptional regulator [Streptomyces hydrogenans]GHI27491.1 TetR family transcriptional regulator [Streptomyces hydrogenans]
MHQTPIEAPRQGAVPPDGERPSLLDRRKTALRLDIACAAVRLFTTRGIAATTGEHIAQEVGVSARTLWRHFPTKESCVLPLLAAGLDFAVDRLRHWPADVSLRDFFAETCREGELPAFTPAILDLIRMTSTEPALRAVWLQAHDDALPVLATLLAQRSTAGADTGTADDALRVTVHAATLNGALRAAVESFAHRYADRPDAADEELAACLDAALRAATEGLPY